MARFSLTIPAAQRDFMASTIASTGGCEVYFLGRVEWEDGGGARLEEIDVFARGNTVSTPAIIEGAEEWDIAIHNHPGGDLTPSEADIAVASELGNRRVGFAIIDDAASRCSVIVPPLRQRPEEKVDPDAVRRVFIEGGDLARKFSGTGGDGGSYELRQSQIDMAVEVAAALNDSRVVALEAGTGVGKSLGYLVPAILWAVANGKRVVVSTNTINLQEQLVSKDLPLLRESLAVPFTFAIIKGRGNYACRRKAAEARTEKDLLFADDQSAALLGDLLEWVEKTTDGSLGDLGMTPREEIWEKIMSETDKSLKVNCQFYERCFYYNAKRQAFTADILVVNHHLFFADLALRRESQNYQWNLILPGYDRVVFDEAHHLEDVASRHLGMRFTRHGMRSRFARMVSTRDRTRGTLPFLARKLRREGAPGAADTIEKHYISVLPEIAERIDHHLETVAVLAAAEFGHRERGSPVGGVSRPGGVGASADVDAGDSIGPFQLRLTRDPGGLRFHRAVAEQLDRVQKELRLLGRVNGRAVETLRATGSLQRERRESLLLELTALAGRVDRLIRVLEFFTDTEDEAHVRWLDISPPRRRESGCRVTCATSPIRVATDLRQAVFEPLKTVIMTSATLSVDGSVDFLGSRIGFDQIDPDRFGFVEFASPFDFQKQARTLVPTDFPDPGDRSFEERVSSMVLETARILGGRTFVLFTSYALLRRIRDRLETPLAAAGIHVLAQGTGNRSELLRRFRAGPGHVLFGTDSFWEGVDVRGRALECVIITRLPFRVPDEPVQLARVEDLQRQGKSAFTHLAVPQAVLKLKQGFGRLIRSTSDRGVVLVLDRRIVTRPYGATFLRSLPPARLVRAPSAKILEVIKEYFMAGESH